MIDPESSSTTDELVRLSFFVDIGKAIVSSHSINGILAQVMEKVGTIFAPQNWSLQLLDRKKEELVFKVVVGEAAEKLRGQRIASNEGLAGWIVKTGQSVIVEDVTKDSRFSGCMDSLTGFETKSIIGVPLKTDNGVIGVLELVNKTGGEAFTPLELKILSTIADFAAIAIEKAFYIRAIKRVSRLDPLTGVLNRRSLRRILSREIENCKRYGQTLSMLMVDIDDFKDINDRFGHPAGDRVLIMCAEILSKNVREVDYVARYGGDEFAIIMPNTKLEDAEIAKDRILRDIQGRNRARSDLPFSLSIGLHTAGPDGAHDIVNLSDIDLYRQKERKEPVEIDEYLLDFLNEEETE